MSLLIRLCLFVALGCGCALPSLARAAADADFKVEVAAVGKSREFASLLREKGFRVEIPAANMWVTDPQSNCAVWIGKNVPLDMLRAVLPEAMRFNPNLKFFYVVGDRGETPPQSVDNTLHVGGNIEAALVKKLNAIDQQEMLAQLGKATTLQELHRYLHERNKPRQEEKPAS